SPLRTIKTPVNARNGSANQIRTLPASLENQPPLPPPEFPWSPLFYRVRLTGSPELHNDLPFGPALFEIRKRFLGLIERKYLVDHRTDESHLEKLADLCELAAVWMHEQK